MISEAQYKEKMERIKLVVDTFLSYEQISITELSKIIQIPTSTIQRDLNNIEYIGLIYSKDAKEKLKQISERLKLNKANGLRIGGINSTINNIPIRDENGKFTGNKRR